MGDPTLPSETPIKRRLSLRVSTDTAEKRAKTEVRSLGEPTSARPPLPSDQENDYDRPGTAASAGFPHHSTSSYSSPSSSSTGEDREGEPELRPRSHNQLISGRSRVETYKNASSQPALWQRGRSYQGHANPSAHSSRRPTSGTAIASRPGSPPNFNLSSGQPLVNPPPKTQAGFVGKLFAILEDEEITKAGLLYWSAGGTTFTCPNPTVFARDVLPRFYKHNNWQSFVRQLNMYSFGKVNDVYGTTSDPHSWEFRHPLFRQGEPQLLASIKRKSSKSHAQDGPLPISPSDELSDHTPKAIAGWMREADQLGAEPVLRSPQRPVSLNPGGSGTACEPPLSARTDDSRPASRDAAWERRMPQQPTQKQPSQFQSQRMGPPEPHPPSIRYHQDNNRPPLSVPRYLGASYPPVSPLYPQPSQPSTIDALSGQIAVLEERLQRLAEMLDTDRVEHVRSNLEFTSHILQLLGWAAGDHPSPEMRALQEVLKRQNLDFRQKYDTMMALSTLPMTVGVNRQPEADEGRGRTPYGPPPSFTSLADQRLSRSAGNDPRVHRPLTASHGAGSRPHSLNATPRTSPRPHSFTGIALDEARSSAGLGAVAPVPVPFASNAPLSLKVSRSSNPNTSGAGAYNGTGSNPQTRSPGMPHGTVPYPSSSGQGQPVDQRVHPSFMYDRAESRSQEHHNSILPRSPEATPRQEAERKSGGEESKAKAGLRNLLN